MPATKLSIETKADGSGIVVPATELTQAQTLTVYCIGRDSLDAFVANEAATAWSLTGKTGSVVDGDLVAAGDSKSAVFTASGTGTATIHATATLVDPVTADSGVVSVVDAIMTLASLKLYLGITGSGSDAFLTEMLMRVTSQIESELEQKISAQVITDILDGSGDSIQFVESARLISIFGSDEASRLANVQYRTSAQGTWTDLVTDEDFISLDNHFPWRVQLLDGFIFPCGTKNIRIRYNGGFYPVPGDIEQYVIERIRLVMSENKLGVTNLTSYSVSEGGMSQSKTLSTSGPTIGQSAVDKMWGDLLVKYRKFGT